MSLTEGQRRCVETLDQPLVVAAGAGSGKTFTLTRRIVHALESGAVADIDEICAITYTKKAAGELKSRIKSSLRACGLVDQALKVDQAWVSTIHGMCSRILRAHAIELGVDPGFTVAGEVQVQSALQRAVDEVVDEAQMGAISREVEALFSEYPPRSSGSARSVPSVEKMLCDIVTMACSLAGGMDDFAMPGVTLNARLAVEQALDTLEGLLGGAQQFAGKPKCDGWIAAMSPLAEKAREALEEGIDTPDEALEAIGSFVALGGFGSDEYKAQVAQGKAVIGACIMELRLAVAEGHLETLMRLAREAFERYRRMKRIEGVLDNNDLLVLAARALENHPAIAAEYADKFKLVMVDEFQDTDQMQVDMVKRLAGRGAARLCTVGDVQQSIYRFRGADVAVYRRHLESVRSQSPGSVIELSENFRSHADILSFVDCVFGKPDMFGGEFMSLTAGRDESRVEAALPEGEPRIAIQHTAYPYQGGVSSKQACIVAARRIAEKFAAYREAGHAAGEMAILLGKMTNSDIYAEALRAKGLPCIISGGSVFARSEEADVVKQLVSVIANPHDTEALLKVLTGPLFALSAGEVLQAGGLKGFWHAAFDEEASQGRVRATLGNALRVMADARRASSEQNVSRVVERVVTECGWLTRLERQGPEGLARAGNVFKAIRILRDIEQSGPYGPASVMRRYRQVLSGAKEAPGALSVEGGDSVRIMTVHASKGLEFPIVAVAEFSGSQRSSSKLALGAVGGKAYLSLDLNQAIDGKHGAVKVALDQVRDYVLGDLAGEDELACAVVAENGALHRRLALSAYQGEGDAQEAKRLLYVALTRAREALVVSSVGVFSKSNPAGVPSGALSGVFSALDTAPGTFADGATAVDFGGCAPALFECVRLSKEDVEEACGEQVAALREFFVPCATEQRGRLPGSYKQLHRDVFSYSSIADVCRGSDLVEGLVQRFADSCDEGADGSMRDLEGDAWRAAPRDVSARTRVFMPMADESDGSFDVSSAFGEDRATDLGTAFHRLAQLAVLQRVGSEGLESPALERREVFAKSCHLDALQRKRLDRALDRWFSSDVAREVANFDDLRAEVAFFVAVPGIAGAGADSGGDEGRGAYMEGEIDLLATSGHIALVVDYKTGGHDDETAEELYRKHVLQASCYAYAVLLQGFKEVETVFVRVEHSRGADESQPQCVRYRFGSKDLEHLQQMVARVYAMNMASPNEKNR